MWKEPLANHNPRLRNFEYCCWSWLEQGKSTTRFKLAVIKASLSVFLRDLFEALFSDPRISGNRQGPLTCLGMAEWMTK